MSISGILFIEDGNVNHIHLYKEGSFWKAYDRSAYLLVKHIRAYQPWLRYYKNMNREVISIGFPRVALLRLIEGYRIVNQSDTSMSIELEQAMDPTGFQQWKSHSSITVVSNGETGYAPSLLPSKFG